MNDPAEFQPADVGAYPATEPLGQPRGSVRAIIALSLIYAFIVAELFAVAVLLGAPYIGLDQPNTEAATALIGAIGIEVANVTAFYFGRRPS